MWPTCIGFNGQLLLVTMANESVRLTCQCFASDEYICVGS